MRNALFLHIQKTAGTSIQEAARRAYGNGNVTSHGDYVALGQDGCAPHPFVSGHFGFRFAEPLMKGRFCFTFLRDPIDRLISLYAFCSSRPSDDGNPLYAAAMGTDLDGFLQLGNGPLRDRIWNNQVWQLAIGYEGGEYVEDFGGGDLLEMAKRNLARFDYIGSVETFGRDAAEIWRALGVENYRITESNVSPSRPKRDELPASTMELLLANTALDRQLYAYARQRYLHGFTDRWAIGPNGWQEGPAGQARHQAPAESIL